MQVAIYVVSGNTGGNYLRITKTGKSVWRGSDSDSQAQAVASSTAGAPPSTAVAVKDYRATTILPSCGASVGSTGVAESESATKNEASSTRFASCNVGPVDDVVAGASGAINQLKRGTDNAGDVE